MKTFTVFENGAPEDNWLFIVQPNGGELPKAGPGCSVELTCVSYSSSTSASDRYGVIQIPARE